METNVTIIENEGDLLAAEELVSSLMDSDNPVDRARLRAGDVIAGPAIVVEMDSTTLIETRHAGTVDRFGNILIYPA